MATLLYRVVRVDTVTGVRRYTGGTIEVQGSRFSLRTDREVDAELPTAGTDHLTGHTVRYEAERMDRAALSGLAETLRDASRLVEEIEGVQ